MHAGGHGRQSWIRLGAVPERHLNVPFGFLVAAHASVGPSNVGMGTEVGWGQLEFTLVLGDRFFELITQLVDTALGMHDRISARSLAYNRDK